MWELLVIFILSLINGFFALSEIAVLSSRRARLQQLVESHRPGAKTALEMHEKPSSFLSTVQVGITLIGILAGAFGGATIAKKVTPHVANIPILAPYASEISLGLVVVMITFVSLVVGELVPKRVALIRAEEIASTVAVPMKWVARLSAPLVWVFQCSSDVVIRLIGLHGQAPSPMTEGEIKAMIEEGAQTGVFEPVESEMIGGVLSLGDRPVRSIMTPRAEIAWIDALDSKENIAKDLTSTTHSRFLVSQGDIDNILGVVHAKDLLVQLLQGQALNLYEGLEKPLIVHDATPILKLLDLFRNSHQEMAVIVDEYGGLEGIATVTDILETIAGALPEQDEVEQPAITRRQDGSWLVDGLTAIDEVEKALNLKNMQDKDSDFNTLAGFSMGKLGHIPVAGEKFIWENYMFEILDMDGRRIDKVLITPSPKL